MRTVFSFLFQIILKKYINLILHVSYISATSLALYYARTHMWSFSPARFQRER